MANLNDRWRTDEGRALAEEVFARLGAARGLDDLGLGVVDGRVDLRGLVLTTGRSVPTREIRGARVEGVDLSGAEMHHLRLFGSTFVDCRWDGAFCDDLRIWGGLFANCGLAGARLPGVVLGSGSWHGRRNVWDGVDFSRADLGGAVAAEAFFRGCDFSEAVLDELEFRQCDFVGCRFAGVLREVVFDGRQMPDAPAPGPMREVDFSAVAFELCEFRGYELVDVVMPEDPEIHVIEKFEGWAEAALDTIAGDSSAAASELRSVLRGALEGPAISSSAAYVLFEADLEEEETVRLALRLLTSSTGR